MLTKYTNPVVTNYRYDRSGSKISVQITESLKINNGIIFLKEIPDKGNGTTIPSFNEVQKPEDLDDESKFYVDYNTGVIYFDTDNDGTKVDITYHGIGVTYYPASRIYLEVDENHDVVKTMSDIEKHINDLSSLNIKQERLKKEIEERNIEISKTLEEVKSVDISGLVSEASQIKETLRDSVNSAKSTNATLKEKIDFSEGVRDDLAKKNKQAQKNIDSLEKANTESTTKTQALNESIDKATKTDESLKATESSITSSLSTYETKMEEIKESISQVDSKSTELKDTIEKSTTADTTLKETTRLANESNENLKATNQKSTELNQELKSENEKADQATTTLSSKIDSGLNVKIGLDDSIAKGKQTKLELDDSNAKATEADTTLQDSTEKAKKEKDEISEVVTRSQQISNELGLANETAGTQIEDLKRENAEAIKNTSGLQTENQNALAKQESLTAETAKADESIEVLKGLLASSANSEQALKEIIASGDLGKYVTDPKLADILTQYATKDDLGKIDVTSQLVEYAKSSEIPKSLLQLADDETHRLVSDEEKNKWNNKVDSVDGKSLSTNDYTDIDKAKVDAIPEDPKYTDTIPDLTDYAKKEELSGKADTSSIPTSLSQLSDDETHRFVTDDEKAKWNSGAGVDLTDYAKKTDLDSKIDKADIIHEYAEQTREDKVISEKYIDSIIKMINVSIRNFHNAVDIVKERIPASLSQLTNDTNFKTEIEIQEMIAKSSSFKKEVVDALPSSGEENVFYLVKDDKGKDGNSYLEYLWINGKWELVGSTDVDLSEYVTKEEAQKNEKTMRNDIIGFQGYMQELIEEKLDKSDLSPFTQQELEEAFK